MMVRYSCGIMLVIWLFSFWTHVQAQTLAFPTAQGFGRFAKGGRGGQVIYVTNLNTSGAGSLKACIDATGPRTCIFRVGGTIDMGGAASGGIGSWRIINPYITIAGQTAPGDGILLKNGELLPWGTHDVIIRHLRLRGGPVDTSTAPNSWGGLEVGDSYNVIFDHCSVSWGQDDQIGVSGVGVTSSPHDITYQWCIITEGIGHQDTFGFDPGKVGLQDYMDTNQGVSYLHNLWSNVTYRAVNLQAGSGQLVNNLIYNTRSTAIYIGPWRSPIRANIVKNYLKVGPDAAAIPDSPNRGHGGLWPDGLHRCGQHAVLSGQQSPHQPHPDRHGKSRAPGGPV